jgi:soluble lytic murein transglycosylase
MLPDRTTPVLLHLLLVLCAGVTPGMARADPPGESARARYQQAEQALASGAWETFRALSESLRDYPLAPDLAVEALLQRLSQAEAEDVEPVLAAQAGTGPGERLRRLWLGRLAREQRWDDYVRLYVDNGSETRACLYRYALLQQGDPEPAFAGLEALYLTGASRPDVCDPLFAAWAEQGGLTPELVWQRVELALARGASGVARYQRHYLPPADQPWLDYRLAAARHPRQALQPPQGAHPRRAEVLSAALSELAETAPDQALEALATRFATLSPAQQGVVRTTAGLALAERDDPTGALESLNALAPGTGSVRLQQQRLRAGLRLAAWIRLPDWIQALPPSERARPQWQYWLGRALEQRTSEADAARAAYEAAAADRSLWGFLAAERIDQPIKIDHRPVPVSDQRLQALLASPRAARVRELQALGRPVAIRREWREYGRDLQRRYQGAEQQRALQEAAALARALGFPSQAILILAHSDSWDDLELRFPRLFEDLTAQAARETGLPEAWLLAIIRQESLFNADAISPAGAIGLMQLMPPTAREVAQRLGLASPNPQALRQPALNIRLGSHYLAQLVKRFDGHVALVTAAYNAGPTRVQHWLPEQPMDADCWIATIAYAETRAYVDRVLTYRLLYADRLGGAPPSLTELLPPVGRK